MERRVVPAAKAETVADAIAEDVARGRYPAGRALPSWADLGNTYGVDRRTAGKALGILVTRGLLVRAGREIRVREGVRVRRRPKHQRTTLRQWRGYHLAATDAGLLPWSTTTSIEEKLLHRDVRAFLGITEAARSIERVRIHGLVISGRRVPTYRSWTWFHPAIAAELPVVGQADTGPGGVSSRFADAGYRTAWEWEIGARVASAEDAELLEVRVGAALVEEWRTCRDEASGRALEVTVMVSNPDLYRLVFP